MSLADEALLKSDIFSKDTSPLEEALEKNISIKDFDKWFCAVLENKEQNFVNQSDYFNCWVSKASILSNINFLKDLKMKIYNITQEHKRLDEKIEQLLLKNSIGLNKLSNLLN